MKLSPYLGKISLLKEVDRVLGPRAVRLLPAPRPAPSLHNIRSILVIRPGGIGDAALLAPTISAVRRKFPDARIYVLAERRNAAVFTLIPGVAGVFLYDTFSGLLQILRGTYDVVIDTEQWHHLSAFVARLTGAPILIGFNTNERRRMFTHAISYSHEEYEADSFLHLLVPLGINNKHDETVSFLANSNSATEQAQLLLGPMAGTTFISIFPGASIRERRWGSANFHRVVRLLELHDLRAVIVGGGSDRDLGAEIVGNSSAINLAGCTSLAVTAAIIASSSLLLSSDSGVLHIGVGLGVPTVSLFGPGIAAKWAPRGERHTVLNERLDCSPCTRFGTTPECSRGVICLSEIEPETVANAILQQLHHDQINFEEKT